MNQFLRGIVLLAVVCIGSGTVSRAAPKGSAHPFGLGIVLGEPTGLSAKYRFSSHQAVDFGLGYSFNSFVFVFSDYLFHFPALFGKPHPFVAQLSPYIGVGGIFMGSTHSGRRDGRYFTSGGASAGLGLRIPVGVEWLPSVPTLGVFVELVPGIGIVPSTFGFFEAGIGARYYF